MFEVVLIGHILRVGASRFFQQGIPFQGRRTRVVGITAFSADGARLVNQGKHFLRRGRHGLLRIA